jgi:predicted double-glycine peptidase
MKSLLFFLIFFACSTAQAADLPGTGGLGSVNLPLKSLNDLRYTRMIKQQYDFSCGAAAVASLLSYHYGHKTDEASVLKSMYEAGDKEKIHKQGFSMLDMQKYLQGLGYNAQGYRAPLSKLVQVGVPAIVLINHRGYMHFVILKGVTASRVLIGDPSSGTRIMSREEFEKSWNGILFVITNHLQMARLHFNRSEEWKQRLSPGADTAFEGHLGTITLDSTATPNYY